MVAAMKTNKKINRQISLQHRCIALHAAILSALVPLFAQANPTGPNIVNGQVSINNSGGVMNITNTPNAIINWQGFSIKQNEITRFIQQNGQSAVLNRVIGQNPSQIMGQLLSNGKVFLINPNGIVFGANSVVDTQGLVASSLNLSNEDFLNGNYYFKAGSGGAGDIVNEGIIRTGKDGNILLIAPNIENSGIISTEGGQVTLAAGEEMTITNLDTPDIQFQIQAPDNEVLNLGKVLTEGGAINLFAGTITHSGELNANSVQIDRQGNIQLIAQQDITLTAESFTTANNTQGDGGSIKIASRQGSTAISGTVQAKAENTGEGGLIQILGEWVELYDQAGLDASGENGGGEILIGGDYQGSNPDIKNATATYVGQEVQIAADAISGGDGGKIIAWANDTTEFYGHISATGGRLWGNGGFAEVSGKENLLMTGFANLTAENGDYGTLLLDPGAVTIQDGVGTNTGPNSFDDAYINTQLSLGNLTISTSAASAGNETITFDTSVDKQIFISWAEKTTLTLNAGQNILINQFSTISNSHIDTDFDAIVMNANQSVTPASGSFIGIDINAANISTVGGGIKLSGRGGDNLGAQYGIYLHNAASISTTNGSVILNGTAGPGTFASNHGVFITDPNTSINVNAGSLDINGVGGSDGTNSNNNGITFSGEAQLSSTTGNITLNGTGPNGTSSNYGVYLAGLLSSITSADGTISITGTGGAGTGGSNYGIFLVNGMTVKTTGSGDIFLNGTGGGAAGSTGNNHGIFINGSTLKTWSGNLNLTGFGGTINAANSYGIYATNSVIGDPTTTTGQTIFKFGGMSATSHLSTDINTFIRSASNVLFSPYNATDTLGFGTDNTSDYQFSDAVISTLLNGITASSIIFGRSDGSGDINLQTATFPKSVKFLSSTGNINILNDLTGTATTAFSFDTGGNVVFATNLSTTTAPGGVFLNKGTLMLGTNPAVASTLNVAGDFTFGAGSTYAPRIGTGGAADLLSAGAVNINPTAVLSIQSLNGFTGTGLNAAVYTVLNSAGITGTFVSPITVSPTILNNIVPDYSVGSGTQLGLNMLAGGTTFQLKVVESDGTYLWSNPANWGGAIPVNNTSLTIPNLAGTPIIVYNSGTVVPLTLTADEELRITGGSLIFDDDSTFNSRLDIRGGTFGANGGVLNVLGDFSWTGGTLTGAGTIDLSGATSVAINGTTSAILDGTTLNLTNAVNLTAGSFTLQNEAILNVADFSLQNGANFNLLTGNFTSTNNIAIDGNFNWVGGTINATNNVNTGSTGIMTITGNNTLTASSINNQGTLIKAGGAGVSNLNAAFSNTGVVNASSGQLNFNSYQQTAGMTMLNGGTVQTGTFNIAGGQLAGNGSLNGNVSLGANAILNPGFSPGILTINGDLSMASGTLSKIEIGGLTQGSLYDWIKVSGNAFLNGTLQVLEINGFSAADGNRFMPFTCGGTCSGVFASTSFPNINWSHSINANDVTLLGASALIAGTAPSATSTTVVTPSIESFIGLSQTEVLVAMINQDVFVDPSTSSVEGGTQAGTGKTETNQKQPKAGNTGTALLATPTTTYTLEQCK